MINPNTFKNEAYKIREIFEDLEVELLEKMSNQLFKGNNLSVNDWKIQKLIELSRFTGNRDEIIKQARKINKELAEIVESSFVKGIKESDGLITDAPMSTQIAFFKANEDRLLVLIKEAQRTSIEALQEFYGQLGSTYQNAINRSVLGVTSGSQTLNESVKKTTQDLAEQGIGYVTYDSGRRVNIGSYMEMATRTIANKTAQRATTLRNKEFGYNLVQISQYNGCSEICAPWQGRIYFDDTLGDKNDTQYESLSIAIEGGLFHPNCKHHKMPYNEEVQDKPKLINNDEELYQKEQQQRYIERNIRQWKRRNAVAQGDDKIKTQAKIKEWQKRNQELVKSDDRLRRDYAREQL